MNAITYAKSNLEGAFSLLNTCAGGMGDAQYNWCPEGNCNSAAKSHVHAVSSADYFINGLIKGGEIAWPKIAQANALPSSPLEIWKFDGEISLEAITEYAKLSQQSALDFVATMNDADLDREIDSFFGKQTAAWLLQLAGTHAVGHGGDIATVKGMQGLKGLPF